MAEKPPAPSPAADSCPNPDIVVLAGGAAVMLAGGVLGRVLTMATQVALARLLGPSDFGLYSIALTVVRILAVVGTAGLEGGLIFYGPRFWQSHAGILRGILTLSGVVVALGGAALTVLVYVLAPALANNVFSDPSLTWVLRLSCPAIVLGAALKVATAATRISQRMRYSVYAEVVGQPLCNLILIGLFAVGALRLEGAVLALVLSTGAGVIIAVWNLPGIFGNARSAARVFDSPGLLRYSAIFLLTRIAALLVLWVDRLLLGHYRPPNEVGIYQAAAQCAVMIPASLEGINAIFAPITADLYHRKEWSRLKALYLVTTRWSLYVSLPLFLITLFASTQVMSVFYGSRYEPGWSILLILAAGQMLLMAAGPAGMFLTVTGLQNVWLKLSLAALAVNIGLEVFLIPRFGALAAAGASSTATGILVLGALLAVRWRFGFWPYDKRLLKTLVAALAAALGLAVVHENSPFSGVSALLLLAAVSVGAFFLVLALLGLDIEDNELIRTLGSPWLVGISRFSLRGSESR